MVLARQQLDTYLSFGLFLAACGIGLGISAVGSTQVVGGLRQLVASTRAIESGADSVPVVVRSRDEVGELALAEVRPPQPSFRLRTMCRSELFCSDAAQSGHVEFLQTVGILGFTASVTWISINSVPP
jgi:hypothetical protein